MDAGQLMQRMTRGRGTGSSSSPEKVQFACNRPTLIHILTGNVAHAHHQAVNKLDADDVSVYKGRIAAMLRPGETIFTALRRLANMQQLQQQHLQHVQRQMQQALDAGKRSRKRGHKGRSDQDANNGAFEVGGGGGGGNDDDDGDDGGSSNVFTMIHQVSESVSQ